MEYFNAITKTRFKELGITKIDRDLWRYVDLTRDKPAVVGAHYRTKLEALADLERYAAEFGCEGIWINQRMRQA